MEALTRPAYRLEHDWEQEPRRLELLEEHADPTTMRRLTATGLRHGWSCLEVGAGRGSIAYWLAGQVGPGGQVTALDLDTSLLSWIDEANVEVVCGDVLELELPEDSFDLIHTRLVLMHIPDRERAIENIVSWLRPGGWLVVEELDWMAILTDPDPDRVALFSAYNQGLPTIDLECGRMLLSELDAAGLTDICGELRVDVVEGATRLAQWEQLSVLALADDVLEAGTATANQIDVHLARLNNPAYRGFGFTWASARGRKPLFAI